MSLFPSQLICFPPRKFSNQRLLQPCCWRKLRKYKQSVLGFEMFLMEAYESSLDVRRSSLQPYSKWHVKKPEII
ncbi:hypothetical protein H5410_050274 [Solanum commersonii]|uniref:Uncharacterized protein n=1 Tax=Solanum commersonii TaxID=4109 RepID=A0A9J5WWC1_SOLCO|nr:hypothetical protein H5410_050274 [Solanum commersonii]